MTILGLFIDYHTNSQPESNVRKRKTLNFAVLFLALESIILKHTRSNKNRRLFCWMVDLLVGAAEWWGGFDGVHSPSQQSSEPGPGDCSSHRQRFHEEERESECGGGAHQAGHQTQR